MIKAAPLLLFIALSSLAMGQRLPEIPFNKPQKYVRIGLGIGRSEYRDFRTSPLLFQGLLTQAEFSFLKSSQKKERELGFCFSSSVTDFTPNDLSIAATVTSFSLYYGSLYKLNALSSSVWNTKIGGTLNILGNYRTNESLNNFGQGYELIPTLFFSTKTELDISRNSKKSFNLWIAQIKLHERERKLSFQLDIGVLNSNARGDIAQLLNSSVSNDEDLFDSLDFEAFSGIRFSSSLDYTIYLKNTNSVRISYNWEALNTASSGSKFEQATHTLAFSLLFKSNND